MNVVRRASLAVLAILAIVIALAACSTSGVGTVPSGTPDRGNGTPAVIASPSPTAPALASAPPATLGATYAFVRANQLWVALHGGKPAPVTKFQYTNAPDVSWHLPAWSPGDRYLAFIMNALPAGLGGGGCPAPDYSANGALYVLNVKTMQATQLTIPADRGDPVASSPTNGYWQYFFWEDATHLLAWYNGIIGKTGSEAGLYRYNLATGSLVHVLPLSLLGVATLYAGQPGQPLLLSMRYSSGYLYYQVVEHPFQQASQLLIYRRAVDQPASASTSIFTMGSEPWCAPQQNGPFMKPGWDISSDGAQLVVQVVSSAVTSSVQVLSLSDQTITPLFSGIPADMLEHDLVLTWGQDNIDVTASQERMLSQDGPYSATLADPSAIQPYTPGAAGAVSWRSDNAAFALQSVDVTDVSDAGSIFVYMIGNQQGQLLLSNARDFVWG
jgi:hypothetical protein